MNHIASSKNGLPLLICTQLTILFVICVPLCSTGIVKREIEANNTTKLIWQPIKTTNNASANVTTTTTTTTTPTTTDTSPSTTPSTTARILRRTSTTTEKVSSPSTTPSTTARILRRTTTSPTTTEKVTTTHATTKKYAERISKENVTEAPVTDTQPVTHKDNLDDDAELITFGDADGGVTTEEHRFDLSRYTSDYNGNDNEQTDYNETHQQLINDNENDSDRDDHMSTYNTDYEHNLRDMVLTTPESPYFDQKHKEYENDKSFERYQDDDKGRRNDSEVVDNKQKSYTLLNDIHGNSTEEHKQSTYLNQSELENTNYDVSASEIKDGTGNNGSVAGEKRAKFMQEGSHVNLTLPNGAEVWALASMKNVEHTKNKQGQFYNVSTLQKDPDDSNNGTLVTKQLADWASVMNFNDFTNSSFARTNNSSGSARIKEQIAEAATNVNGNNVRANNRTSAFNDTLRGKTKYQTKPLIATDQDSASQENQIIAVRMTTLPPPIVLMRNNTHSTQTPTYPQISDSQNKINFQHTDDSTPSVTDMVTESDEQPETTTTQTQTVVDNSQNELKIKFTIKNVTTDQPAATKIVTTTDGTFELTTEIEQKTSSFDVDDMSTTTEAYETTTLLTTMEPAVDHSEYGDHTTTEREFPTTNHVNLETESIPESITEVEEDAERTTLEQISVGLPITTEDEILQSQSSTLQPQFVEIEKTTEMKKPTTEITQTSTEFLEPTTEFIAAQKEHNDVDRMPEPDADNTQELTTTIINLNRDEYKYSTIKSRLEEPTQSPHSVEAMPEVIEVTSQPPATGSQIPDIGGYSLDEPDTNAVIAISISVVGVLVIGAVLGVLLVLRKRKKQLTYGQRCRPVGLDAYSLDNVSVYNSVRRKGMLRMSKRSYGNAAFDDPGLKNNLLTGASLAAFAQKRNEIYEEFKELPAVTARAEEVPVGCEDKNRYANIVPLPETRVHLKRIGDDERTEYINANFVKGPKDNSHYYIACQAPLESTIVDFWRMVWEQNSRVIIMATDLIENGIEQCSEYLPPSFVIDNHVTFGDFHITLKNRDVKEKYAMSMVHLKNTNTNTWREVTHFWYQWPDTGVPTEQSSVIDLLLEARGYLKVTTSEQIDDNENSQSNNGNLTVGNGNVDKSKSLLRTQGPLTVHCSPGTGRTGTLIACDIALRALEQPTRSVDIPQIVYFVRRGRASAVRTREQYEFIYKVANVYAAKLTGPATEN